MIEGVGTLTNVTQDKTQIAQNPTEEPRKTTDDVVEGKVNPVDPSMPDESASNEQARPQRSQDIPNRGPGEESIIDVVG